MALAVPASADITYSMSGRVGINPSAASLVIGQAFGNNGWRLNGTPLAANTLITFTYTIPDTAVDTDGSITAGRFTGGTLKVSIPSMGVDSATTPAFHLIFFDDPGSDGVVFQPATNSGFGIVALWRASANPWPNPNVLSTVANPIALDIFGTSPNSIFTLQLQSGHTLSTSFTELLVNPVFSSFSAVTDAAPIAKAGDDFSVNEGQPGVALNGSLSSDPDGDALTYAWTQLPGGTAVTLTGAGTASPTFTAPVVALGGETLSFDLTVTANGKTSTDTVSVTVVNVNHPPVAEAGPDQSVLNGTAVAEGSPVTLDGSASFDIDSDVFTHAWVQVSGPAVTLTGADTSGPTFTAPYAGTNGAAGVVATLVFELLVDDGFPADSPATGYTLANVRDSVTVEITNTNNLPIANAGADQTVDENSAVSLSGELSSDPDSDTLTYAWTQTGGPAITLAGDATATPSFTAPFVSAGGADLEFEVTVDDGYGGTASDTVVIRVQNSNDPPLASAAQSTVACLWPPNHQMVAVGITGVSDPDNNATITITGVTQDEPTNGLGDGDTAIDAVIDGGTVLLRAERSGKGDGRVYRISFTASDLEGSASGTVKVCVPHSPKKPAIDSLSIFDSTN